jgi:hypothetical protein
MQEVSYPRTSENSGVKLHVADRKKVFNRLYNHAESLRLKQQFKIATDLANKMFLASSATNNLSHRYQQLIG